MPIATHKVDATLPVQASIPKIEPTNYQSIVNDDKVIPIKSLLAYIEGSSWNVDYYKQIVSKHNDLREVDPGQPNIYQQYEKITGLEIRVTTPLNDSYDSDTGITTVTGDGLLYPFIIPNALDYFIADAGDSKKAIFRITTVERKSFNTDSVFAINYDLVGYTDNAAQIYDDLVTKTIRTYFFNKDRLVDGLQPVIKEEEHNQLVSLSQAYKELVAYYFKTFFNRNVMTLVLPGQEYMIYDSFLVNYLMKLVDTSDAYEIQLVKQITTDNDLYLSQPQFWTCLFNRDYDGLAYVNKKMLLVNKAIFHGNSYIHGLAFSNIDYIVYPDDPDTSTVVRSQPRVKPTSDIDIIVDPNYDFTRNYVTDALTTPYVNGVMNADETYVLSEAFYSNLPTQSLIEIITKDYLKRNTIDLKQLLDLYSKYRTLPKLEQFYYGPMLITFIKEANRAIYT